MSRIQPVFAALEKKQKKALIPFIIAGYPEPDATVNFMHALVRGGADIIELGVPFSDPMADGPVIQRASEVALEKGVNLRDIFRFVRQFRERDNDTPVVLMGYANPVERMGVEVFVKEAHAAGVDGVLIVDYPPEASENFVSLMEEHGMDVIFLLAPTSNEARMEKIGRIASGYVYYVSLKGVTGSGNLNLDEVASMMSVIRRHVSIPVCVGFGIRDPETAGTIGSLADGVVIGSKMIQVIENAGPNRAPGELEAFASAIRKALDG